MTVNSTVRSHVPLTAAEAAVVADMWERRGVLGRLRRLDGVAPADETAHVFGLPAASDSRPARAA
jgi:hypothetical protein